MPEQLANFGGYGGFMKIRRRNIHRSPFGSTELCQDNLCDPLRSPRCFRVVPPQQQWKFESVAGEVVQCLGHREGRRSQSRDLPRTRAFVAFVTFVSLVTFVSFTR